MGFPKSFEEAVKQVMYYEVGGTLANNLTQSKFLRSRLRRINEMRAFSIVPNKSFV
ncbi:MAG: hypothetical protein DDT31_00703 [Syntrophomonadaceae bacterium]|nr:hypothetical protein [Bacillota bacterium]